MWADAILDNDALYSWLDKNLPVQTKSSEMEHMQFALTVANRALDTQRMQTLHLAHELDEKSTQLNNALIMRNEYKQAGEQALIELEKCKKALAKMWFAYENKDTDFGTPHAYETEAVAEAKALLGQWSDCMPTLLRLPKEELLWCKQQIMCVEGITCAAHMAEGRAFACPYTNNEDRKKAEYPCGDYEPTKTTHHNQ